MSDFPALSLRTPRLLDSVHDIPGDALFVTMFNHPETMMAFCFGLKGFMILDSLQLGFT